MNTRGSRLSALGAVLVISIALCGSRLEGSTPTHEPTPAPGSKKTNASILPPHGPTEADYPALHNLVQVTDNLYSGGEPHIEASFAQLADLGIKTVVSVDGATPDLEMARKYGLRYVHIPIGYDGIDEKAGQTFARLAKEAEGPLYVHCHHGRHRGPAAAAITCIAAGDASPEMAKGILEKAGTSESYAGLWRDVAAYVPPGDSVSLPELVEVAQIDSLAAAMAKLDRAYEHLKRCEAADWKTPEDHPDLVPAQEALLIKEGFHESRRNLGDGYDARIETWLAASEAYASELEQALKENNLAVAADRFVALKDGCSQCHKAYRN